MPAITPNWLDRLVLSVFPRWGKDRLRDRAIAQTIARHYAAATVARRSENWTRTSSDANAVNGPALSTLRALSHDLLRNNGWAINAVQEIVNNVVGWGITAKATGPENRRLAAAWKAWADKTQCDADGLLNFYGLEALVVRTVVESGECLIRRRPRRFSDGLALPLQLQVLEPDFLDTSMDGMTGAAGGPITQGVEFDMLGRRAAYWLFSQHPGSAYLTSFQSKRVPASDIIHVCPVKRAGQVRGAPWLAAAIVNLKDFDEYEDADLLRAKIAACFVGFSTDANGEGPPLGEQSTTDTLVETFEPGMFMNLPPGRDVKFGVPPITQDNGFSTRTLRRIAAAVGVTYEGMTGDYCVAPETRILRSDLRWVRADSLVVGDSIVGFDEKIPGGCGRRRCWRKARVLRSGTRTLNRRRITTDRASVVVSDEHLFLCTGRSDEKPKRGFGIQARSENPEYPGAGQRWVRADRLQPGDRVLFLHAPWEDGATHLHGYLKGIADGEAHVDLTNAKIGIAQNPGLVLDEIGRALASLGFVAQRGAANGRNKVRSWDIQGIGECLHFLGEVRPTRLLSKADSIYVGRYVSGGAKKSGRPTYATVQVNEPIGEGTVVTMETSTRTLVTEGLLSHNSQVNFSSARMSRIRHWGNVRDWRWNMLIPQLCDGVWAWAMEAAATAGLVETPPDAEWTAPPMPMIEPDREGLALSRLVRNGAMTFDEMVRERGLDPAAHWEEYAANVKKLKAMGIMLDSDASRTSQAGLTQERAGAAPRVDEVAAE